jgi:hypothetical protein
MPVLLIPSPLTGLPGSTPTVLGFTVLGYAPLSTEPVTPTEPTYQGGYVHHDVVRSRKKKGKGKDTLSEDKRKDKDKVKEDEDFLIVLAVMGLLLDD